jgi:hypothetical protein
VPGDQGKTMRHTNASPATLRSRAVIQVSTILFTVSFHIPLLAILYANYTCIFVYLGLANLHHTTYTSPLYSYSPRLHHNTTRLENFSKSIIQYGNQRPPLDQWIHLVLIHATSGHTLAFWSVCITLLYSYTDSLLFTG